jgi:N4-gp56 family major capsid protein
MADSYTQVSSLTLSQTAYDKMAYFALRPELYFDQAADVRSTNQSMNGSAVQFTIVNDLAIAITPLSETTDVSAVSMSDSTITVTLVEYGNAVVTTAKLRGTSYLDIDPMVANVVGYNAGVSLDTIARAGLDSGSQVLYASGLGATTPQSAVTTRVGVTTSNTIASIDLRVARAILRSANVATFGGMYIGYVHPDIVADLQGEALTNTQSLGWRAPHTYSQPNEIWTGELGSFEGIRFIETPRAPVLQGTGASGINVYATLVVGRQSLAKAHSISDGNGPVPHIIPGPITDHLRRLVPLGWYWLGGYSPFRTAAVMRIESASLLNSTISETQNTGTTDDPAIDLGTTGTGGSME